MPYSVALFRGQHEIARSNIGSDLSSAVSHALNVWSIYQADRVIVTDEQTGEVVYCHPRSLDKD